MNRCCIAPCLAITYCINSSKKLCIFFADDNDDLARCRFRPNSSPSVSSFDSFSSPSFDIEKLTPIGATITGSSTGETGRNNAGGLAYTGFVAPIEMAWRRAV